MRPMLEAATTCSVPDMPLNRRCSHYKVKTTHYIHVTDRQTLQATVYGIKIIINNFDNYRKYYHTPRHLLSSQQKEDSNLVTYVQ